MLVWFFTIGVLGIAGIVRTPAILGHSVRITRSSISRTRDRVSGWRCLAPPFWR